MKKRFLYKIKSIFVRAQDKIERYSQLLAAILLTILVYFNISGLEELDFQEDKKQIILQILESNLHHFQAALVIFIIFGDRIKKVFSSTRINKEDRLNLKDFFDDVSQSHKEIRILETFTESLIKEKVEFKKCLIDFIENGEKKLIKTNTRIRILLLNPNSYYAESRIKDLHRYYEIKDGKEHPKSEFVPYFQDKMTKLISELISIQTEILNSKPHSKFSFDIKIYDTPPPFSLYSCDNIGYFSYYAGDKPTTESPQTIIRNLKSEFQLDRFEDIWESTNTKKQTIDASDFCKTYIKRDSNIIKKFKSLSTQSEPSKIQAILEELEPGTNKVTIEDICSLIVHLESKWTHGYDLLPKPHYNIFGTGGDKFKTLNISTIAAILASHYPINGTGIVIKKVGTMAVTGEVGSQQFYSELQSLLNRHNDFSQLNPEENIKRYDFAPDSEYVNTLQLRYKYRIEVRQVRNNLYLKNHLDIYKVIFPIANFTGCKAQINGISDVRYLSVFQQIYTKLGKTGILLHNEGTDKKFSDEMLVGRNEIYIFKDGQNLGRIDINITLEDIDMTQDDYIKYFSETEPKDHVKKFIQLFSRSTAVGAKKIFAYNIALIAMLTEIYDMSPDLNDFENQYQSRYRDVMSTVFRVEIPVKELNY